VALPSANPVIIVGEPADEIAEAWQDFSSLALVWLALNAVILAILYFVLGRVLDPLANLSKGMLSLEDGLYATRLATPKVKELAIIAERFNTLAGALETARDENSRLYRQLITVQEEERREIANELPDRISDVIIFVGVALSQPALEPSGTSHIFIDTTSLALDAPGKIVQQNTGTDASPDGIRITSFSPLIQILGQPSVVDLFARVTWGVTEIPPLVVALSPFVVVDGTSNSWRINGCVIHVAPVCASMSDSNLLTFPLGELTFPLNSITPLFTNLRFPSSNEGPNALVSAITSLRFSDIIVSTEDGPDALGNDPTITGSGNDEISR
jgi:HAMP domain-containing protein